MYDRKAKLRNSLPESSTTNKVVVVLPDWASLIIATVAGSAL